MVPLEAVLGVVVMVVEGLVAMAAAVMAVARAAAARERLGLLEQQ